MFQRIFMRRLFRSSLCAFRTPHLLSQNASKFRDTVSYDTASSKSVTNLIVQRLYSQQQTGEPIIVEYDYVKKATSNDKVLIVDVREPDEIKELGKIPNSINIPLGNVTTVLSTTKNQEFELSYQKPKPTEDTEIIFYCMSGKRSGKAQQNALSLGYKNVKNYLGSWTDWATKIQ